MTIIARPKTRHRPRARRDERSVVVRCDSVPGHVAASLRMGLPVPGPVLRFSRIPDGARVELRLLLPTDETILESAIELSHADEHDVASGHFWPRRLETWLLQHGIVTRIPEETVHAFALSS